MSTHVLGIARFFASAAQFRRMALQGLLALLILGLPALVRAQSVRSLTFSPDTIVSGSITTGTVTLSAPAPAGGASVAITQGGKTYGTAIVAAGQTGVSFSWEWFETQTATVDYLAQYNGSSVGGSLNVTFAPWTSEAVGVAGDGTSRVLSVRNDGAAGVWSFDTTGAQTGFGTTFGPVTSAQGDWSATSVAAASDDTSRLLWTRSDGAAGLWTVDANGRNPQVGTVYGPYSDAGKAWTAKAVGVAGDGTSRLLWTRSDGAAGLWTLNTSGTVTLVGPTYGPISGWAAKALGVGADGTARLLWVRSDGAAGLWSFGTNDAVTAYGTVYGPFSDSGKAWTATAVGVSNDGTSRVLWDRSDGVSGLWTFGADDAVTTVGGDYGPYSNGNGLWTAKALGVSLDGTSRVLWTQPNATAGLWSFGANDAETVIGAVYGPY